MSKEAEDAFGSHDGEKWVGFTATYPGNPGWPTQLETNLLLRDYHKNPKHIQLILVMFTFSKFAAHFLHGISTCVGPGIHDQIETRSVFIPTTRA